MLDFAGHLTRIVELLCRAVAAHVARMDHGAYAVWLGTRLFIARTAASPHKPIPRDILNTFIAKFGDAEVFRAELGSGISANPFISFQLRVPGPGTFEFAWIDDNGTKTVELTPLNVV